MKREYRCKISICDSIAAAMSMSPEAVAAIPESWTLCPEHLSMKLRVDLPKPKRRTGHSGMVCYGEGGKCPNIGALYPGGPYCEKHSPRHRP